MVLARSLGPIPAVLVCMVASGCGLLVADNPDFEHGAADEVDTSSTSTGDGTDACGPGEPNGLDCDEHPGCESDRREPETCGTCDRSCWIEGQRGECLSAGNDFECSGVFELPAIEDVYILSTPMDHNAEGELRLIVSESLLTNTFIAGPDLELIPDSVEMIELAELRLTSLDGGGLVLGHVISSPWTASMIDWNTRPMISALPELMIAPVAGEVRVDVTTIVQTWRTGAENHGIALLPSPMSAVEFLALESGGGPTYELTLRW